MPQCDSSETYTRAVWPRPSPAVLRLTFAAGISAVSRFSCMKFLGVLWGLRLRRTETRTRGSALVPIAFRALQRRRRPDCQFSQLHTHPADSPVYASPSTSRCPVQNSGPSGSLVLSREASSSSASCRFSPAHCNCLLTTVDTRCWTSGTYWPRVCGYERSIQNSFAISSFYPLPPSVLTGRNGRR